MRCGAHSHDLTDLTDLTKPEAAASLGTLALRQASLGRALLRSLKGHSLFTTTLIFCSLSPLSFVHIFPHTCRSRAL